jgi:hypothetical protein
VVSFEERFIRWFLFHDFGSVLPSVKRVFQAGGHGIRFSGATLAWSNPDTHPLYTLFPARAQRFSSVIVAQRSAFASNYARFKNLHVKGSYPFRVVPSFILSAFSIPK